MSGFKIAFLILAHEHPQHLARLAASLEAPWSDIYVHINRSVDDAPFARATAGQRVTFVPDALRCTVHWSGFSLLEAILALARYALEQSAAERFCFLSVADYPIKPLKHIQSALECRREYLRVDRELNASGTTLHDTYIRYPHLSDLPLLNQRSTPFPRLERMARGLARHFPRQAPEGIRFYHGSCWAALTRDALKEVVSFVGERPELLRWLRYTRCPEEILFHSALKRSRFAESISDDRTDPDGKGQSPGLHGCHYIDWHHPNPDLPATLDLEHLPELKRSPALFARKVHPVRSAELLDAIDSSILMAEPSFIEKRQSEVA